MKEKVEKKVYWGLRNCDSLCEMIKMKGCEEMMEWMIDKGEGRENEDIVIKGGRLIDIIKGEMVERDIEIWEERIVGNLGKYSGKKEIDV